MKRKVNPKSKGYPNTISDKVIVTTNKSISKHRIEPSFQRKMTTTAPIQPTNFHDYSSFSDHISSLLLLQLNSNLQVEVPRNVIQDKDGKNEIKSSTKDLFSSVKDEHELSHSLDVINTRWEPKRILKQDWDSKIGEFKRKRQNIKIDNFENDLQYDKRKHIFMPLSSNVKCHTCLMILYHICIWNISSEKDC